MRFTIPATRYSRRVRVIADCKGFVIAFFPSYGDITQGIVFGLSRLGWLCCSIVAQDKLLGCD